MARARPKRMRVGALEREAGLTRDVIHHYVKLGLIPAPEKSNATVSWYDERHLAALKRVRAMKARGLSLAEIKRFLDVPSDAMGLADLDAAATLLAAPGRPTVARETLPAGCDALLDAIGLTATSHLSAPLADALSRLVRAAPAEVVCTSLAACADAIERATEAVHRASLAALTTADDPVTASREASSAMGAALDAWRAQREHGRTDATLRELTEAARTARRSPWLSPAPAVTEGASLRLVVLDRAIEATPGDASLHVERVRLLLGASSSRRAGEAARTSQSLGIHDPWMTLALGVAALDRDACDEATRHFEASLTARPKWGLAEVFLGAAKLYGAARAGDGLIAVMPAIGLVDRAAPHGDDRLAERLRTRLVAAQTRLALPPVFDRRGAVIATLREVLDEARGVPLDDLTRGTGELARIEGNAWLTLGDARALEGDRQEAADAWQRALNAGGRIAYAARARLRGAPV